MGVLATTTIVLPTSFASMGSDTSLVTPWKVRSPSAVEGDRRSGRGFRREIDWLSEAEGRGRVGVDIEGSLDFAVAAALVRGDGRQVDAE